MTERLRITIFLMIFCAFFCVTLLIPIEIAQASYQYQSQFGSGGAGDGQFNEIHMGIVFDSDGNIYVADAANSRVQVFNSAGVYQSQFGVGEMSYPVGIAISPTTGDIYVADAVLADVLRYNSAGVLQGSFSGTFIGPHGIDIDGDGNVYVADYFSNKVQIFDANGGYISEFGTPGNGNGQFSGADGIKIHPTTGDIYVVDGLNSRVQIFNSAGVYQSQFGTNGSGNGQFDNPIGIAISSVTDRVYVTDFSNYRVQVFDSDGNYLDQFGIQGDGDGEFYNTVGVNVRGATDTVYVTDYGGCCGVGNNRVQIFLNGEVSVLPTSLSIVEGLADDFSVVLTSQPSDDVVVSLSVSTPLVGSGITLSETELTFTPFDWDTPQVVTVTAIVDSGVDGDHLVTISSTVTSLDNNFDGSLVPEVSVTIRDLLSISTCLELQAMNDDLDGSYLLTGNIDCSDTINWNGGDGFEPIGANVDPFTGIFDGAGFVISDLYINRPDENYVGLFGNAEESEIKDFSITGSVEGDAHVGAVIGSAENVTMEDISSQVNVTANGNTAIGGLVGDGDFVGIFNSNTSSGNVTVNATNSITNVGGLVGTFLGDSILSSSFVGNIIVNANDYASGVGGIIGGSGNTVDISNSYAICDINVDSSTDVEFGVGGLVGYFSGGDISRTYVIGDVVVNADTYVEYGVGGLVGYVGADITMSDNFFQGDVNITTTTYISGVGGLVGFSDGLPDFIDSSYAVSDITLDAGTYIEYVGGFIGEDSGLNNINNSFSEGSLSLVSGTDDITNVAGFSGDNNAVYINNFYNKTNSGQALCVYGVDPDSGCTAIEDNSTYFLGNNSSEPMASWDFTDVWGVYSEQYPILRALASPYVSTVTTSPASSVTKNGANLNGSLDLAGFEGVTDYGFEYGIVPDLSTVLDTVSLGTTTDLGEFTSTLDSLDPSTLYYFRAYSINNMGTSYGSILSFETSRAGGTGGSFFGGDGNMYPKTVSVPQSVIDTYFPKNSPSDVDNQDIERSIVDQVPIVEPDTNKLDTDILVLDSINEKNIISENSNENSSRNDDLFSQVVEFLSSMIRNLASVVKTPIGNITTKILSIAGIVAIAMTTLSASLLANISLSEPWQIPYRLWSLAIGALGLKRKFRPWGTVYDSVTKQPLDPAYVVLTDQNGKEITSAITDLDGRYGFLLSSGTYKITAGKTHYTFPSIKLAGKTQDELYSNLYFGESFSVDQAGELVIKNIPMDQEGFDWNEFTKGKRSMMLFYNRRDLLVQRVANVLFVVGLVSASSSLFFVPEPYNFFIFGVYVFISILRMVGIKTKAHGSLREKSTGSPLSFAVVTIYSEAIGGKIAEKVADKFGRYYAIVPPGEYHITIQKKNDDASYEPVYSSSVFHSKDGIINLNIDV